jgi:hypothetical protein
MLLGFKLMPIGWKYTELVQHVQKSIKNIQQAFLVEVFLDAFFLSFTFCLVGYTLHQIPYPLEMGQV